VARLMIMMMTLTNRPQQDEQADTTACGERERERTRECERVEHLYMIYVLNCPYVATVYTTKDHWLVTEHAQEVFIGGGPPPKFN